MEIPRGLVSSHSVVSFFHVKRDANKVANMLSNIGVERGRARRMGSLEDFRGESWALQCRQFGTHDFGVNRQVEDFITTHQGEAKRLMELPTKLKHCHA